MSSPLNAPEGYHHGNLLLVTKEWIQTLLSTQALPPSFPSHPSLSPCDTEALLKQRECIPGDREWVILEAERHPRKRTMVCPLPKPLNTQFDDQSFAEALRYVGHSNFINAWKEKYKALHDRHVGGPSHGPSPNYAVDHDTALLSILTRLHPGASVVYHDCPPISAMSPEAAPDPEDIPEHLTSAVALVVEEDAVTVLSSHRKFSLHHAVTFSPAFLGELSRRSLFVLYQLLRGVRRVHDLGLCLGDVTLHDVTIDDKYYVALKPVVSSSLQEITFNEDASVFPHMSESAAKLAKALKKAMSDQEQVEKQEATFSNFLSKAVMMWKQGSLSNFDYILFLNYLSGRNYNNPNHYPVLPWVKDFSSETLGWRDLSKSKFRLNKGDTQLDLTFDSLKELSTSDSGSALDQSVQAPHHVTEVLSEITYYVYKARRTPASVLCKHVRNRWVPAEYPSSMQRLQEWTPDECIPEFFTDPSIFVSIHDDLPDLEIPPWCQTPKEFVVWHRSALESSHVSEKLHEWIDLTFGHKLSGAHAVQAKNVCLQLVDDHTNLKLHGVVQLFGQPHPRRDVQDPFFSRQPPRIENFLLAKAAASDSDESDGEEFEADKLKAKPRVSMLEGGEKLDSLPIALPKDFNPLAKLEALSNLTAFLDIDETDCDGDSNEKKYVSPAKELATRKVVRDLQVLGCLILELYLPKKFLTLGKQASLKARFEQAKHIIQKEFHDVPTTILPTLRNIILNDFKLDPSDRFPAINSQGLPPPTEYQLLMPFISDICFPSHFDAVARLLRQLSDVKGSFELVRLDPEDEEAMKVAQKVGEFRVRLVASELGPLIHQFTPEDVKIILPTIKELFTDSSTSILASWHLLEHVGTMLGRKRAVAELLDPILGIYEGNTQTSKHLKLYHRTFLQFLLVRFGTQTFLRYFSTFLIEAVGGYKDYEDLHVREGLERVWKTSESQSRPSSRLSSEDTSESIVSNEAKNPADSKPSTSSVEDNFAEGEVFSFDSVSLNDSANDKEDSSVFRGGGPVSANQDIYIPPPALNAEDEGKRRRTSGNSQSKNQGNIAQVAAESTLWLAHRVGPVLTAKHITRNLLRMLNLCYSGPENVAVLNEPLADSKIRIGSKRIHGDNLAQNVLKSLADIACLYGDQIILIQYIPYTWELIQMCKKKLTQNLEGGLLGSMSLLHHLLPYLSDSMIMNELTDNLLSNVFVPTLQLFSSRSLAFPGGWRARQVLVFRFLDVLYLIGLRIGEEMARSNFSNLCAAFFSSFDKVYDGEGKLLRLTLETAESKIISNELAKVLTPSVAYAAYVTFYNLMGRARLDNSILNIQVVKKLCLQHQESGDPLPRPANFNCLRGVPSSGGLSSGSPTSSGGNQVSTSGNSVVPEGASSQYHDELHDHIFKEVTATSGRHLKGNWLAYWEHEIGRSEKDSRFNLKQIKLQSFVGHTAAVKCLYALDNENSFLSGSRDKTVKVWSLRSGGDGGANVSAQWTYGLHKRSVFAVHFLESANYAVSCDSALHIWDPFVGSGVHQIDTQRTGPVHMVAPLLPPSPVVLAATPDNVFHLVDCRVGNVVRDIKVNCFGNGNVRSFAPMEDGNSLVVGHQTGNINVMDLRTGNMRAMNKGHEGEVHCILSLTKTDFLATSIDQTMSVNSHEEAAQRHIMSSAPDPVLCMSYLEESRDLICASPANRISVRHGLAPEASFHSHKLRADIVKGNLTSMRVLPLNKLVLLGQDNGNLNLLC